MSQEKSKKYRKLFTENLKDKVHEAAEKLVNNEVQRKIKQLELDEFKTARQRDIFILISIGLFIIDIIFFALWLFN